MSAGRKYFMAFNLLHKPTFIVYGVEINEWSPTHSGAELIRYLGDLLRSNLGKSPLLGTKVIASFL